MGIADEYPGNPDITSDLGCLDNLKKLKRVSIYNTSTTNCEQFTKSHPDLAKTKTESGKQGGGGCSKQSLETLVDYAQKYEKKIGKEVQTEVRGKPNYNKGLVGNGSSGPENGQSFRQPNIFQRLVIWVFSLFGKTPPQDSGDGGPGAPGGSNERPSQQEREEKEALLKQGKGPGGCKSQAECQTYCSNPDHREECDKFGPPGGEPPVGR